MKWKTEISVTVEELTEWIPAFIPFPRILIVRLYPPGVKPAEPNKFKFAVVAVIWIKTATIKALVENVSPSYMLAGARALKEKYKVRKLKWRHNGAEHEYTIHN